MKERKALRTIWVLKRKVNKSDDVFVVEKTKLGLKNIRATDYSTVSLNCFSACGALNRVTALKLFLSDFRITCLQKLGTEKIKQIMI